MSGDVKLEAEVDYILTFKDGTTELKTYKSIKEAHVDAEKRGAEAACGSLRFIVQK